MLFVTRTTVIIVIYYSFNEVPHGNLTSLQVAPRIWDRISLNKYNTKLYNDCPSTDPDCVTRTIGQWAVERLRNGTVSSYTEEAQMN